MTDVSRLDGVRAIIVEDSFVVAESLQWLLESHGCRVTGKAANVARGLALADTLDYDVAILDVRLGDDVVTDVARRIRDHGKRLVYLTAYADLALIPPDVSGFPVVRKPVHEDGLIDAMLGGA
jgi:two-component SAPR family response regulator